MAEESVWVSGNQKINYDVNKREPILDEYGFDTSSDAPRRIVQFAQKMRAVAGSAGAGQAVCGVTERLAAEYERVSKLADGERLRANENEERVRWANDRIHMLRRKLAMVLREYADSVEPEGTEDW